MKRIRIAYNSIVKELKHEVTVVHGDFPVCRKGMRCKAIWDTGNSKTVISSELARRLGIDTTGESHMRGSSFGQGMATSATVNISIGEDVIPMVEVDVISFTSDEHYDVILGMDVIARGRFEVDSTNGATVLAFEPIRDDDGQIPILRFVYDEN